MTDKLFDLFGQEPLVSLILGAIIALVLIFILKDEIRKWVIKRYDLYNRVEISRAVELAQQNSKFIDTLDVNQPSQIDLVLTNLRRKKKND